MAELAEEAGVPVLDAEEFVTHTHTFVFVTVNGVNVPVPAGLGIAEGADDSVHGGQIAALHTHELDNKFHVESAIENDTYLLSQGLMMWGITPTAAGLCAAFQVGADCDVKFATGTIEQDTKSLTDVTLTPAQDGFATVMLDNHVIVIDVTSPRI